MLLLYAKGKLIIWVRCLEVSMLKIIKAKLHGLHVTDSSLNYHGSITLDPEHCALANFYPLEFVDIWNKNSGARISTYVIFGEPGSKCCVLNGAAARTCQKGDALIVAASQYCQPKEITKIKPKILTFTESNHIDEILEYDVQSCTKDKYTFSINKVKV